MSFQYSAAWLAVARADPACARPDPGRGRGVTWALAGHRASRPPRGRAGRRRAAHRRPGPVWRRHIPPLLFLAALTLLLVAVARPQATVRVPRVAGTVDPGLRRVQQHDGDRRPADPAGRRPGRRDRVRPGAARHGGHRRGRLRPGRADHAPAHRRPRRGDRRDQTAARGRRYLAGAGHPGLADHDRRAARSPCPTRTPNARRRASGTGAPRPSCCSPTARTPAARTRWPPPSWPPTPACTSTPSASARSPGRPSRSTGTRWPRR